MRIRSGSMGWLTTGAIVALSSLAAPRPAAGAWPPFGRGVATAPNAQQHPAIATDGAGGAIVAWQDLRNPRVNVFAQHLLPSGEVDPAWPSDGVALLGDPAALEAGDGGRNTVRIVPDGAGGAIVAWLDNRSAVTETDVYAQHVLASGLLDPAWPPNGAALCAIEGPQNAITIVPDGGGGAIATWVDGRPGASGTDVYAQHVLVTGLVDPRWPLNGAPVCVALGSQEFPAIAADGAGGAIVTWDDLRDPNNDDVFAQHVRSSGTLDPAWPVDGLAVCSAAGNQGRSTVVPDGAHGAVVAWTDGRATNSDHIFAQHVLGTGSVDPAWPADGRLISGAADLESRPLAVSDGAGGAIVTWQGFTLVLGEYAQHVTAAGVVDPAWPPAGRRLSASELKQDQSAIASDGAGGAIVAWHENDDILAQHVRATGALDPAYSGSGRVICGLPSGQGDPAMVATGDGGAIVAWADNRSGASLDIYAMQVLEAATTGVPDSTPPGLSFRHPGPNPARGSLTLRFALSRSAPVRLAIYDVAGRRVRALAYGDWSPGEHAVAWDLRDESGRPVGAGSYFARFEAEGRTFTERIVALR